MQPILCLQVQIRLYLLLSHSHDSMLPTGFHPIQIIRPVVFVAWGIIRFMVFAARGNKGLPLT